MTGTKSIYKAHKRLSRYFHWMAALIVMALLCVGFYMVIMESGIFKLRIYSLHKSFGLLVLFLTIARAFWHLMFKYFINPRSIGHRATKKRSSLKKRLSLWVRIVIYTALFAMPLSGWLMSSAGDFPAGFFGMFEMPDPVPKNKDIFRWGSKIHEIIAYIILGAVLWHSLTFFKHNFARRCFGLRRMFHAGAGKVFEAIASLTVFILLGISALLILAGIYISGMQHDSKNNYDDDYAYEYISIKKEHEPVIIPDAGSMLWKMNREESHIYFAAAQYGRIFKGEFTKFTGQIYFDPENLEQSSADITIYISGINTGSEDRDEQALTTLWFDTSSYPEANFRAKSFERIAANRYRAKGNLTLRNISLPVVFPFSLEIVQKNENEKNAFMRAKLTLNRLDFGIGQGEWGSTEAIGNKVEIEIFLTASYKNMPSAE